MRRFTPANTSFYYRNLGLEWIYLSWTCFFSDVYFLFFQNCSTANLEKTILRFSTFSTAIQNECLPYAPTNIFCGKFAITLHECIRKSNQRYKTIDKQTILPENMHNKYHCPADFVKQCVHLIGTTNLLGGIHQYC